MKLLKRQSCRFGMIAFLFATATVIFCATVVYLSLYVSDKRVLEKVVHHNRPVVQELGNQHEHEHEHEIKKKGRVHFNQSASNVYIVNYESGLSIYNSIQDGKSIGYLSFGTLVLGNELIRRVKAPFCVKEGCGDVLLKIYSPMIGYVIEHFQSSSISSSHTLTIVNTTIENCEISCSESFIQNSDIKGFDLPNMPLSAVSPETCCNECNKESTCNSWTFTPGNFCWLKSTASVSSILSSKPFHTSGLLSKQNKTTDCFNNDQNQRLDDSLTLDSIMSGMVINRNADMWTLRLNRKESSWTEQWPIGNGKFGALIGGQLYREIIPLSISGLYFARKKNIDMKDKSTVSPKNSFLLARESLRNGELWYSRTNVSNMINRTVDLGMFQYAADFGYVLSNRKIDAYQAQSTGNKQATGKNGMFRRKNVRMGREGFFDNILNNVNVSQESNSIRNQLYSNSILDLRHGISTSQFVEYASMYKNDVLKMHNREWFASELDNVIVGKISSDLITSNSENDVSSKRFHIAMSVRRDHNINMPMPILQTIIEKPKFRISKYNERMASTSFVSKLEPNENIHFSSIVVCGVIQCVGYDASRSNLFDVMSTEKNDIVICNDISAVHVYLSISMQDSAMKSFDVIKDCKENINKAVEKGYDQIKAQHMNLFSSRIENTSIVFENEISENNIHKHMTVSDRILGLKPSVPLHANANRQNIQNIQSDIRADMQLLMQSFQYGRYLMLSCGTRSVGNLQGIWADGPTSAWNGDYHLNINIQQLYWSVGVANMPFVIEPLMELLEKLSDGQHGQINAKELYDCTRNGWISHGFVDNTYNGAILGDAQWAMCVTCGAWLATQVFDTLLFHELTQNNRYALLKRIVPILRGVILFFNDYIFMDEQGTCHTGPTTSPENSYRIFRLDNANNQTFQEIIEFLTFSPALDSSVLRQVSNSFVQAIQWLKIVSVNPNEYSQSFYESDLQFGKKFQDLIHKMPGHAVPVIGHHGRILEYPNPFPNTIVGYEEMEGKDRLQNSMDSSLFVVDESLDPGHRHFSGMHWLYPNIYQSFPGDMHKKIYDASVKTLTKKVSNGGGHTNWSGSWLACLQARLGLGDESLKTIFRVLYKYSSDNMLSLHPALMSSRDDCHTCFAETFQQQSNIKIAAVLGRGMVNSMDSKFQLDGNLGVVAAMSEMLIQSHGMGRIHLLPAFSMENMPSGRLTQFRTRGSAQVSYAWNQGVITAVKVTFPSFHPWWIEYEERYPGFVEWKMSSNPLSQVTIISPNILHSLEGSGYSIDNRDMHKESFATTNKNFHSLRIKLPDRFPCVIELCDSQLSNEKCQDILKTFP